MDRLTECYRKKGLKVGIVAIDPTSPITGGALLGDRIRMVDHTMDSGVFIRSMASRGWAGGLSGAVADVIQLLDAAGMDIIMVETVGIGQSDTDVVRVAHAVMVVLMPGLGDDVQASKAGLMEIGDVYVVNKADLTGGRRDGGRPAGDGEGLQGPQPLGAARSRRRRGRESRPWSAPLSAIRSRFLSSPSRGGDEIRLKSIRGMITELAQAEGPRSTSRRRRTRGRGTRREGRGPQDHDRRSCEGALRREGATEDTEAPRMSLAMDLAERLGEYASSLTYDDLGLSRWSERRRNDCWTP